MSLPNIISPSTQTLEPRLLHLLQTHLDTFIKWDIVRHFHEQPHLTHTAAQLARVLGRDERVIVPELLQLTRTGLLSTQEMADMRLFTYTDDLDMRTLVADFFSACQDRRFRVQAICQVIRGLR